MWLLLDVDWVKPDQWMLALKKTWQLIGHSVSLNLTHLQLVSDVLAVGPHHLVAHPAASRPYLLVGKRVVGWSVLDLGLTFLWGQLRLLLAVEGEGSYLQL